MIMGIIELLGKTGMFDGIKKSNVTKAVNKHYSDAFRQMLLNEFTLDDYVKGINITINSVETKNKVYLYSNYGISNIRVEDTRELARWICHFSNVPKGSEFRIGQTRAEGGGYTSGTSYLYETPGGNIGIGDTSSYSDGKINGYRLHLRLPQKYNK